MAKKRETVTIIVATDLRGVCGINDRGEEIGFQSPVTDQVLNGFLN